MTFTLYDSTDPTQYPAGTVYAGYYADGWAQNLSGLWSRFGKSLRILPILIVRGQIPALKQVVGWRNGVEIDIEPTDWEPPDAPGYALDARKQGVMPHWYINLSSLPLAKLRALSAEDRAAAVPASCDEAARQSGLHAAIERAAASGLTREDVKIRTAHWTGQAHICTGIAGTMWGTINADATQWWDHVGSLNCDISLCEDTFFSSNLKPPPVAKPSTGTLYFDGRYNFDRNACHIWGVPAPKGVKRPSWHAGNEDGHVTVTFQIDKRTGAISDPHMS